MKALKRSPESQLVAQLLQDPLPGKAQGVAGATDGELIFPDVERRGGAVGQQPPTGLAQAVKYDYVGVVFEGVEQRVAADRGAGLEQDGTDLMRREGFYLFEVRTGQIGHDDLEQAVFDAQPGAKRMQYDFHDEGRFEK